MSSRKNRTVNLLRASAGLLTALAIAMVVMVALPSRAEKAALEEELLTVEQQTAVLENRLETYKASGLTAAEFQEAAEVLDITLPFAGPYVCPDGSAALTLAFADIAPANIPWAVHEAALGSGIPSDLADYSVNSAPVTSTSSLAAYDLRVEFEAEPGDLNSVVEKLTESGFLVTVENISILKVSSETDSGQVLTTTSANLLFWYSVSPMYSYADLQSEYCTE